MRINKNKLHLWFRTGIIFKTAFAWLEVTGGIVAYFVSQDLVARITAFIFQGELAEDQKDLVANYFLNASEHLTGSTQHFASVYLFSHGLIKLITLLGLLKGKLWAYVWSIVVFGLFIVYQLYRFTLTGSWWLLLLTVIDVIIIWLVWLEYRRAKNIK